MTLAVFITSYSNFIRYDCSHIEHVAPYYLCTFDNILELYILLRLHHLWSAYIVHLCVICNSNRLHSVIFKHCIMIVHALQMCTDDAGPKQSSAFLSLIYPAVDLHYNIYVS